MTTKDSNTSKTTTATEVASRAEELTATARDLAGKVPDAAEAMRDGAIDAWRTVETMPKSQQRTVAGISLGVGAGLFVLGAPRLLILLAFLPAVVLAGLRAARGMGSGRKRATG